MAIQKGYSCWVTMDTRISLMETMPMQHLASSTLSWSERQQVYELSVATRQEVLRLTSETPAWFAWLEEMPSFAFHGQHGSFTARKETKPRGSGHWHAYPKREGTLPKKQPPKPADLPFPPPPPPPALPHPDKLAYR